MKLNERAYEYAKNLIADGKFVIDDRRSTMTLTCCTGTFAGILPHYFTYKTLLCKIAIWTHARDDRRLLD